MADEIREKFPPDLGAASNRLILTACVTPRLGNLRTHIKPNGMTIPALINEKEFDPCPFDQLAVCMITQNGVRRELWTGAAGEHFK